MSKSKIEWLQGGSVWNPVTGCTKVSAGCKNCYAERQAERFWGDRKFTDVQCHADRLDQPLRWRKPRRIFVNSMSDLFHDAVPFDFIDKVFAVMALAPRHTFLVLTKRPERMRSHIEQLSKSIIPLEKIAREMGYTFNFRGSSLLPWPIRNIWLGVSVEDQATADERIPILLKTPAAKRFVSYEPALGKINLRPIIGPHCHCDSSSSPSPCDEYSNAGRCSNTPSRIDWIICGGESGPNARPMHPDWARSVRDQCQQAGVPFFFKQWGEWSPETIITEYKNICLFNKNENGDNPVYMRDLGDDRADDWCDAFTSDDTFMYRIGKKRAGRLLDGREWNEVPN